MPRHLTVATVIEANKIASATPFLEMIEIDVRNAAGVHVEWIRLVKNSENVTFEGEQWYASNFSVSVSQKTGEEPSISVSAFDITGVIRGYMERYDGGVGFPLRYVIANADRLDEPAEISEDFTILSATAPAGFEVRFTIGTESPLRLRFPISIQEPDRCRFKYKGVRCKYAGLMATCDYTKDGANGCIAHDNEANFGGFPALRYLNVS